MVVELSFPPPEKFVFLEIHINVDTFLHSGIVDNSPINLEPPEVPVKRVHNFPLTLNRATIAGGFWGGKGYSFLKHFEW